MAQNPFSLEGKNAWVTGASYGIGFNIAKAFVGAGIKNIIFNDINQDLVNKGLAAYKEAGIENVHGYVCDVTKEDDVKALVEKIHQEVGQIDILVNNAGIIRREPFTEHSAKNWNDVIAINLSTPFFLSQAAAKQMAAQGQGGKIINIASMLSFQGGILVPGYAASKGGVKSLTMLMANELAKYGIRVNAIAPGYIATDNTAPIRKDKKRNQAILDRIPAGRWGTPDDLKGICVFLASPASDYMTGYTYACDGGWLAR